MAKKLSVAPEDEATANNKAEETAVLQSKAEADEKQPATDKKKKTNV